MLDNLGARLLLGTSSWILEVGRGECSWLNLSATSRGGVGIILANKYASIVTMHGKLYKDIVAWIKLAGIQGGNVGIICVYAPNIPMERNHL